MPFREPLPDLMQDRSKAALLDFDGVLADSVPVHKATRDQALSEVLEPDEVARITEDMKAEAITKGSHSAAIVGWLLEQVGRADDATLSTVLARKDELYSRHTERGLPAKRGARRYLRQALAYYVDVAIVTTATEPEVEHFLRRHHVEFPEARIYSRELAGGQTKWLKPDPYLYRVAVTAMGCDGAFAVEDTPGGVMSARGAGVDVVGFTGLYDPATLEEAGATAFIGRFPRLPRQEKTR